MDAAELVDLFGLGTAVRLSPGPVARGRQGDVWQLETVDGVWAVKVPFDPVTEQDVAAATRLQEAAYDAGVPTPRVVRTPDGRVLAEVGGRQVRLFSWVDVLPPDPGLDPVLVGRLLARLHRTAPPAVGPVGSWYVDPVGAATWDRLVADLRDAGAPFAGGLAGLRDDLVALEGWLRPAGARPDNRPDNRPGDRHGDLRACHRDLWADNLLGTPDGGLVVLDWENGGAADPAQELGCVLFEFARDDPARVRALAAAYREAGGPARLRGRGDFGMLIAQLGHITELAARDWLAPNRRNPDRAAAEAWVREVLDDPHTPERLDALLEVARTELPGPA